MFNYAWASIPDESLGVFENSMLQTYPDDTSQVSCQFKFKTDISSIQFLRLSP